MPGLDSLKQAVANGLGIGIVPRAAVSSLTPAGLVAIPLPAVRAASTRSLVYRGHRRTTNGCRGLRRGPAVRRGGPRLAKSPDRHEGREVKLSYVHGVGTTPLIAETIGGALNGAAERWGDRDALVACHQQLRYSYRELRDEADRAARGLIALGVQRGDRVGMWSGNRAEWIITQYAAAKAGAVLVNINPAYRLRELEYALTQSGVSVLVAARGFRSTDYVELLLALMPELAAAGTGPIEAERVPALRRVIYLGADGEPGGIAWVEFLEMGNRIAAHELEARETTLQFDDPINIQYTSGTTGSPKGATLSHHNILNNAYFVGEILRYTERDRICVPVPFYHCFGCVLGNLAALTHGSAVVIPGESFDPDSSLRAIEAERCTSIYGVPTMFIAQLDHPRFNSFQLETLRTGIMAGAPCPIDVMRQVIGQMHVPQVTICYGMTETSPVSFQSETMIRLSFACRQSAACCHTSNARSSTRTRRDRSARHARRAVHARLRGHARVLER
jgi:fatty-acyl-CoA synthase